MKVPHADEGAICPLHKVDTSTVCHKCPWWTHIMGKNPQTEEIINDWRCAVAFLPLLLVENSQMQRQTSAAVESLRNNVVKSINESIALNGNGEGRIIDARDHHRS